MQLDVVDLLDFYRTPLGQAAADVLSRQLSVMWPDTKQDRVLGLGFPTPFLGPFVPASDRVFAFMPAGQGTFAWPKDGNRSAVLVDETARYRLAYTAAGLSPDGGSTWLLPRLIGLRRAQELIFENRELSAAEAVEWGLATRTVPEGTALESTIALAQTFAKGPTQAFASSRRMLNGSFENDFITQTDIETREIGANMTGVDGQEGLDAFINKRPPAFTGRR